jgi:hypothetical protein
MIFDEIEDQRVKDEAGSLNSKFEKYFNVSLAAIGDEVFTGTDARVLALKRAQDEMRTEQIAFRRILEVHEASLKSESWRFLCRALKGKTPVTQFISDRGRVFELPSDLIEVFMHNRGLNGIFKQTSPAGTISFIAADGTAYPLPYSLLRFLERNRPNPTGSESSPDGGTGSGTAYEGSKK